MRKQVVFLFARLSLIVLAGPASANESRPNDPYGPPAHVDWSREHRGEKLDLTGYHLTFEDNFDDISRISADGGKGPWFAPIHSTVGAAEFMPPTADPSPFSIDEGILTIRAQKVNGKWQTGHMQTSDSTGRGFSQQYGYFEIRAKFPPARTFGAWPAFWLYSTTRYTDLTKTRAEIDVIEYYPAHNANGHHCAVHLRPALELQEGEVSKPWFVSGYGTYESLVDGSWHLYGALVTPDWIIIYLDGAEVNRFPMLREFHTPLYMLVSNQMLNQEAHRAKSPIDVQVAYVRVYARE